MMPFFNEELLLTYNRQGLIPGPGESETDFFHRAKYCLDLKETIAEEISLPKSLQASCARLTPSNESLSSLYDISPDWVPVYFSDYQLAPWQGGCAWIFQASEEKPTAAFFQLRKRFESSPTYLGLYSRTELMNHELAHVGRMMFEEPKFEEIIAYRTASSKGRRFWGAIVQSSTEAAWFVFLLLPLIFLDLYLLFSRQENVYWQVASLKLIPLSLIALAAVRLYRKQKIFSQALNGLVSLFQDQQQANAVIYRLTDKEIEEFAGKSPGAIQEYAGIQTELRWRLLNIAYFSHVMEPRER